jgi:hypothetical protein
MMSVATLDVDEWPGRDRVQIWGPPSWGLTPPTTAHPINQSPRQPAIQPKKASARSFAASEWQQSSFLVDEKWHFLIHIQAAAAAVIVSGGAAPGATAAAPASTAAAPTTTEQRELGVSQKCDCGQT